MSSFISTATPLGRELARRLFNATRQEDFHDLIAEMTAALRPGPDGHLPDRAPADDFVFHIALAQRGGAIPNKLRVCSYDAAGFAAMGAHAYPEALFAFEHAQEIARCPARKKRIEDIRHLLVARDELVPPTGPASCRQRAPSSVARRSARTR